MDRVATVEINKCMGCGTCVGACPLGAISRPGVSNPEIKEQLYFAEPAKGAPRLLTFVCDWCLRAEADVEQLENYPENVRVVHIPCSGRIDPEMALLALRSGIDGVLVCGCEPGECHYQRGTLVSACKMGVLDRMFKQMDIAGGRVRFVQIGTRERGRIKKEVDTMLELLTPQEEVH